ncbi:transposase [Methanocella arvoryzae]|uniref:Transposase (IS4) n=1 Tax=Methanocella arvoryzae (strain DSM 22066 / NBRC 105507 / MRE50) TaxID=351160 RepID=Q0W3S0_METAR|nr:transposase [Methanocella arvoryzae]CAJ36973.1 transposase (IS4) [Methanocella arvoryzae MRE50]
MKASNGPRVCSVKHVDINLFARMFAERFDFPRSSDYARCLVHAAVRRKSLESIYNNHNGLPPDSFFNFFKYSMSTVVDAMDGFFHRQAGILGEQGCVVAVDTNDVEYWGDTDDEYVHCKKGISKNAYVLRYASVSVVDEKHKLTLACLPVSKNDDLADIVKLLLEKARTLVKIDTVLLDRGFYSTRILKIIREMGMDYVIPLKKQKWSDLVWEESKATGVFKHRYILNKPVDPLQTWVYLSKKKEKKNEKKKQVEAGTKRKTRKVKKRKEREYVGVISSKNVHPEAVPDFMDWYFVRNNVEISYKEKNCYKILTCSTDKAFRLLIYCICHYLMNLSQVVRTVNRTFFRNDELKKLVKLLLEKPFTGEHRLSRTLVVIA